VHVGMHTAVSVCPVLRCAVLISLPVVCLLLQQCMAYLRSAYGGREDASMKTMDLQPSKILSTGAGADVDEVSF
jgi:hypothetical protein